MVKNLALTGLSGNTKKLRLSFSVRFFKRDVLNDSDLPSDPSERGDRAEQDEDDLVRVEGAFRDVPEAIHDQASNDVDPSDV